jgi:hypothetical protein
MEWMEQMMPRVSFLGLCGFGLLIGFGLLLFLSPPQPALADSGGWPTPTITPIPFPTPEPATYPPPPTELPAAAPMQLLPTVTETIQPVQPTPASDLARTAKPPARSNWTIVCLPLALAFIVVAVIVSAALIARRG